MAGGKDYTTEFLINARLNGGFNATFSKAQQEFARLGKEIQGLQLQYEKLDQRIGDTVTALERQKQKFSDTGARLKEAGVDTANLTETNRALKDTIKELGEEQRRAAEGAQTFGEKAAAGFDAAGQALAAAGIAAAVKELTDGFAACVGIAGDFEEAMSTVEALSQAGAREMSTLSAEAKALGAVTKFTARESAGAMGLMANSGVKGSIAGTALRNTFTAYTASIAEGSLFPQGYAAVLTQPELLNKPSVILADIGGWTVDLMRLDNQIPNAATCRSPELGMILCLDEIAKQIRRRLDLSMTAAQIESVLQSGTGSVDGRAGEIIQQEADSYVHSLLSSITESGLDARAMPAVFLGGGRRS